MKKCMYCGNENDDSSQNCSKCGNPLLDIPPQQAVPSEITDAPEVTAEEDLQEGQAVEAVAESQNGVSVSEQDATAEKENGQEGQQPYYEQNYAQAAMEQQGYMPGMPYGQQEFDQNMPYEQQPYYEQGYNPELQQYNGQAFGTPEVQQQYGGQAYGYQQQPAQYGEPYQQPGRNQSSGNQEQLMIKGRKCVKSFLFFLVAVCFTGMLVASVLNIVSGSMQITLAMAENSILDALGDTVFVPYISTAFKYIDSIGGLTTIVIFLLLNLPALLICIGLWMMFFATSVKKDEISTTGYTMVKVIYVLKFIGCCLLLGLLLAGCVAFVVAAGASESVTSIIVGVVVLLILIVISVLVIMFYVQLLHMMKVVKRNCRDGSDVGGISLYVPVVGILIAISKGLSMIPMSPDDIFGLICQGCTAGWMLLASFWVFRYRAKTAK